MQEKLLELAITSTELVEKNNYMYYWEANGYKFNNINLARWYEKEFNCWVTFVARQLPQIKQALENTTIDMDHDYDLDFVKQIKKDYDYVRLLFSGGYDSGAAFLSFVKNGEFLDETVSQLYAPEESDITDEVIYNAKPFIEQYKDLIGKSTFVQITHQDLNAYWNDKWSFFRIPTANTPPMPMGEIQFDFYEFEHKENSCFVKAIDKPQLIYYKNKWYVVALDSSFGSHIGLPNLVYFWLDARNIKGLIKHARMYRDFVKPTADLNKPLEFFKFWDQEELNYIVERPTIPSPEKKCKKRTKQHLQRISFLAGDRFDIVSKYCNNMINFQQIFPETENGFGEFINQGKFAWLIDIDSLEVFTQQELIPDGFEIPARTSNAQSLHKNIDLSNSFK